MDRPDLAESLVRCLFAEPVLAKLRSLARATHTSSPGSCSFDLPMPLHLFCHLSPGTGLTHTLGNTQFTRPQYVPLWHAGTVQEPPALELVSEFPNAASLEQFLGQGWNCFTIREDSSVGLFTVGASIPSHVLSVGRAN